MPHRRSVSSRGGAKCELAAALLHHPKILFLDEPTLGLDVSMQKRLREFARAYNERTGATVLLTSHYMADVVALCTRVILIHRGEILFDGTLASLVERFAAYKTIAVEVGDHDLSAYGEVISRVDGRVTLRVEKRDAAAVTGRLLADLPVSDLTILDPPIDEVIDQVFTQ